MPKLSHRFQVLCFQPCNFLCVSWWTLASKIKNDCGCHSLNGKYITFPWEILETRSSLQLICTALLSTQYLSVLAQPCPLVPVAVNLSSTSFLMPSISWVPFKRDAECWRLMKKEKARLWCCFHLSHDSLCIYPTRPHPRPLSAIPGCECLCIAQHNRTPAQYHRLLERCLGRDLWRSVVQPVFKLSFLKLEGIANARPASCGFEPRYNCSVLLTAYCTLTCVCYVTVGQWQPNWVMILFHYFLLFLQFMPKSCSHLYY